MLSIGPLAPQADQTGKQIVGIANIARGPSFSVLFAVLRIDNSNTAAFLQKQIDPARTDKSATIYYSYGLLTHFVSNFLVLIMRCLQRALVDIPAILYQIQYLHSLMLHRQCPPISFRVALDHPGCWPA